MKREAKLRTTLVMLAVAQTFVLHVAEAEGQNDPLSTLGPSRRTALAAIEDLREEVLDVNRAIWSFAEVGMQEAQSSALLVSKLKSAGFDVKTGVADLPTAFVATYGSGRPVIGLLAEYDALPGMSQRAVAYRVPEKLGAPGHACAHSGLGAGAFAAAVAVKRAMQQHQISGTLRLYGTPAEETVIGKVYMLLGGQFRDLDTCLHWHPSNKNEVWSGSSKALISVKFTFHGVAAHASGSPERGRSALDAVELMNVGVNYMREHVKNDARIHYVVTKGGDAPNVVPAKSTVWYFVRADNHHDAESYFQWIKDIAHGAARMTRTKPTVHIETDCHELVPNTPLSELLYKNMKTVGSPSFSDSEKEFARRLQQPLIDEFQPRFPLALDESIHPPTPLSGTSRGSTDVGDISWFVPTGGIRATCFAAESPGHSWQNVASIRTTIGEKGILYASKVLALSTLDLMENPALLSAARVDWAARMKNRTYTTLIPKGQRAPRSTPTTQSR